MNARSASMTTHLRPNLSASRPESGEMRRAKRAVEDVMRDLSRTVRGCPSEEPIETRVADITPVSSTLLKIHEGMEGLEPYSRIVVR